MTLLSSCNHWDILIQRSNLTPLAKHRIGQPRRLYGLGLVNPFDQQFSLSAIYIQRLLKQPLKYDFLASYLQHNIQLYTSHSSPLPLLLLPSVYLSLGRKVPTLKRLCALVKKLPQLVPNLSWSPRWVLDLPLSDYLLHNLPILGRISNIMPPSLPLRYTLPDIAIWNYDNNQLVARTTTSTRARAVIHELFPSSSQADATICFD
ncbi:hypothetical protein G6F37_008785 [Rhizopus arrhizus]|nr:hypothetical protein G6F38_008865 [Rhizopus arrhizus]KAG1155170.1 hypothetical protein G6F37_008785 [Rhizopus arrhizus]